MRKRACFTGHRPEKLSINEEQSKEILQRLINIALEKGCTTFITGMARGIDIWAGELILKLKDTNPDIRLVCAVPYVGFESKWSKEWRDRYQWLLAKADHIEFIQNHYSAECFMKRNMWMVDHSQLVISIFNGTPSGTKNTLDYARKKEIKTLISNEKGKYYELF